MSNSNTAKFWQYAEEAMLVANVSKREKEKKALIQLAHIWAQSALRSEVTTDGAGVVPPHY